MGVVSIGGVIIGDVPLHLSAPKHKFINCPVVSLTFSPLKSELYFQNPKPAYHPKVS